MYDELFFYGCQKANIVVIHFDLNSRLRQSSNIKKRILRLPCSIELEFFHFISFSQFSIKLPTIEIEFLRSISQLLCCDDVIKVFIWLTVWAFADNVVRNDHLWLKGRFRKVSLIKTRYSFNIFRPSVQDYVLFQRVGCSNRDDAISTWKSIISCYFSVQKSANNSGHFFSLQSKARALDLV